MPNAAGEAPGKVLLIGEHAVVYGHPAIAVPLRGVCARAEVELTRNGGVELVAADLGERVRSGAPPSERLMPLLRLVASVLEFFGEQKQGLRITLHSTIPPARGMGSSAAAAVAIVRGVCGALARRIDADQVSELALAAERGFHGNPSGVDCAVVARNKPVYFVRGKPPQDIAVGPWTFRFLVADTGIESPTANVVRDVQATRERERARVDSYLWELGSLASVAREVIRAGTPPELGACMSNAHMILQTLGVSCSELDRLVAVALSKGALGAKLSGAGRGGVMIALVEEAADEERLTAELRAAGAGNVFATMLGGE